MAKTIMTKTAATHYFNMTSKKLDENKIRFDLGKYSASIKGSSHSKSCQIWYERRTDKNGVYFALYTINSNLNQED